MWGNKIVLRSKQSYESNRSVFRSAFQCGVYQAIDYRTLELWEKIWIGDTNFECYQYTDDDYKPIDWIDSPKERLYLEKRVKPQGTSRC